MVAWTRSLRGHPVGTHATDPLGTEMRMEVTTLTPIKLPNSKTSVSGSLSLRRRRFLGQLRLDLLEIVVKFVVQIAHGGRFLLILLIECLSLTCSALCCNCSGSSLRCINFSLSCSGLCCIHLGLSLLELLLNLHRGKAAATHVDLHLRCDATAV